MFAHYDRSATNISNDKIDPSMTALNYNLAVQTQPLKQKDFLQKRMSEVKVQKRADVNVMVDWVLTAPQDLLEKDQREFFESAYQFLSDRYGGENVVSAHVHMDETTPHMHFSFIPVVEDKKKGGKKLCAKDVVNRADLKAFHGDLSAHVEQALGYEVGILNEATAEGNMSIDELKRKSAAERLEEIESDRAGMESLRAHDREIRRKRKIELDDKEKRQDIRENELKKRESDIIQQQEALSNAQRAFILLQEEKEAEYNKRLKTLSEGEQALTLLKSTYATDIKNGQKAQARAYEKGKASIPPESRNKIITDAELQLLHPLRTPSPSTEYDFDL